MGLLRDLGESGPGGCGEQMHALASALYPICRSITGDGIRQTLRAIGQRIPLEIHEVPSGTQVFDWTVPKEWNIRDAYIKDPQGRRVVDFRKSSLHVLNYSAPVNAVMRLEELKPHLFTLPEHPDWIPYRTSYYKENWGFCLSENQLRTLEDGDYEVCIDSSLEDGHLSYGEVYLRGSSTEEVLISCHACHPSLANDNLSGVTVAAFLAQLLQGRDLRYSYRFLFLPGTIGSITWLARNREAAQRIRHGLVLTCVGDAGGFHYKKSRRGDTEIDRVAAHVLRHCGEPSEILDFSPYGYDERQYCSPGFNLAVGCLMRSVWGEFPEYHTSADNLAFIRPAQLERTLKLCLEMVDALERNRCYTNENPYCEPQLGKRNLYRATGGGGIGAENLARLWAWNLSDGEHSVLEIAERSGLPFATVCDAAELLAEKGLLSLPREERERNGTGGRAWSLLALPLLVCALLAGSLYSRAGHPRGADSTGRVIRYRDPMHPAYTSDKPGFAPDCGMKLEPVDAQESAPPRRAAPQADARGMVSVGPERQQWIGVVRGLVERGPVTRTIRASGRVSLDESRVFPVIGGADGIVRSVFKASTDTGVQKGQPLVSVYGREYLTAQRTLLYGQRAVEAAPQSAALEYQDRPAFAVEEARLNLLDMGFGEAQVRQIMRERKPVMDVLLVAPESGTIVARNAFAGQRFNRGAELFRIADTTRVWIVADLFGEDSRSIRPGASAEVSSPDAPGSKAHAIVSDAQPRFNPATHVLTVRLEMANPRLVYLPDMVVDVAFHLRLPEATSVPAEAVVDSGMRKTVFVDRGNGVFEARAVETGARFDGRVEIVRGLEPGEPIVVSGNFLLDSESRMRTPGGNGIQH